MKATVVIPTYNRSKRLGELLRCLAAQRGDALARVVVCDDGSTDDTRAVAQGFAGRLPLEYRWQPNLGFRAGQARNLGIDSALGEVVLFVDDDVLVAEDFVAAHVAAHAEEGPPRVVVGYRHRAFGFEREQPRWEDIVAGEPDDRVEVLGADGHGLRAHETPWFFVYSCNFSVRREAAEHRFDEGFHGWGMEDLEFGYRLWRAGHAVVAAPRARVLHIEDPAPRDPFRCEVRELPPTYDSYVKNSVYFMDKYPEDATLAKLIRTDMRWYVRDEERDAWVKNGHANDVEAVLSHCRRERAARAQSEEHTRRPAPAARAEENGL